MSKLFYALYLRHAVSAGFQFWDGSGFCLIFKRSTVLWHHHLLQNLGEKKNWCEAVRRSLSKIDSGKMYRFGPEPKSCKAPTIFSLESEKGPVNKRPTQRTQPAWCCQKVLDLPNQMACVGVQFSYFCRNPSNLTHCVFKMHSIVC